MASPACCSIPPVVTAGYAPKGTYETHGGFKAYVTGSSSATTGVLYVYDIFGYAPQTLQGADIVAAAGKHLVVMPDLLLGVFADTANFPADTPEKQKALGEFFKGPAELGKALENVGKVIGALKEKYPGIGKWAVIGLCWGAKVVALSTGESTQFSAAIQCHPALLDAEDAKAVTVPHLFLPSKDEPKDAVAGWKAGLETHAIPAVAEKSRVHVFETMHHGWMGARARLEEEEYRLEYEKGYKKVVHFLKEVL